MRRRTLLAAPVVAAAGSARAALPSAAPNPAAGPMGPLRASRGGRYFARPDGSAVYLAGSHVWTNLQDANGTDPPAPFDYTGYLELLRSQGHNFMRLWAFEAARASGDDFAFVDPLPYLRTGPGLDGAGKPRFDLTRFDPAYFDRLRARVEMAAARGIYVGVMLWNTWSLHEYEPHKPGRSPWPHHPYNARNNVNGIDGDPRGTGDGAAGVQSLAIPAVTALQEAYARRVVDTLNDLDNVLYEIGNEPIGDAATAAWQNHMIGFLRGCQSGKAKRHPIGMTGGFKPDAETINAQLLASGADWISLAGVVPQDRVEPPEAPAGKVSLLDTDHVFGVGGDALWVWKAFVRGHNVLFMDALVGRGLGGLLLAGFDPDQVATQDSGRVGVAGTRAAAAMVGDMEGMAPLGPLCSTGRALADPGRAYVALATEPGPFTLDLAAAAGGRLRARWIAVATAAVVEHGTVLGGASAARFEPPFAPAALVLTRPPA